MSSQRASAPPRRILLVEMNHDGTFGGSHQAMFDLARHLDPTRYTALCLFYEHNPFVPRLRALGLQVFTWNAEWNREHSSRERWFTPRQAIRLGEAVARRIGLLRFERIDLVHINNSPSYSYYDWLPAAKICGIPCVTHLRGELHPIGNRLIHWLNCRFDRYIAISTYVRQLLESENFPRDRILQIDDGIDIEAVRNSVRRARSEVRAELGVESGVLLAVMVGNLKAWKGQDVVLQALGALRPDLLSRIRVVFAGADDPSDLTFRPRLADLVSTHRLDSNVRFLGSRTDVPDLMNAADLVLHASTRPEPFGLVVLEGMALGRLVIAAGLGGPLQILGDGGGWMFDPREPIQLTQLLSRVIDNPTVSRTHASVALSRAQHFTVQRTSSRVQHVYDELLA
jgi:glycosyltransferase involved in cell wall biosynthesis